MKAKILLVENNEDHAQLIADGLKSSGFLTKHVVHGRAGGALSPRSGFSAIILDSGLPDSEGLSLLRSLRSRRDPTPVLVTTSATAAHDRVACLRSGADDCLAKPFAVDELIARVEALLRRSRTLQELYVTAGNLCLDRIARRAFVDGRPLSLSSRELTVLEILMTRKGQVVPKKLVEDQLADDGRDLSSNAIEVYVHRLRGHLAEGGAQVKVQTVRGAGYTFSETHPSKPALTEKQALHGT